MILLALRFEIVKEEKKETEFLQGDIYLPLQWRLVIPLSFVIKEKRGWMSISEQLRIYPSLDSKSVDYCSYWSFTEFADKIDLANSHA